jgi:formamidopyrimidine-DNA glycosylase
MPELPEVETALRGIAPYLTGKRISGLEVREPRLRWPVPAGLAEVVVGRRITDVRRRGKYLLIELGGGTLLVHLGMSGSLRVLPRDTPPGTHDHIDVQLDSGRCLRLRDPRRFGAFLWLTGPPERHPLLRHLGPEPLGPELNGDYLFALSRGRHAAVKTFLMDAQVVAGIGNIYANESLFLAGIHPGRPCNRISRARYRVLADRVKQVLEAAIAKGGTTLRDFVREDGSTGYFSLSLAVYGRAGAACPKCGGTIRQRRIGQRSSFYCPRCQR